MIDYKKGIRKAVINVVNALDIVRYLLENYPSNCTEKDASLLRKATECFGEAMVLLGNTSINKED